MKSTDSVETVFKPSEVSWAFNQHRREFGTAGFNYNPGTSTLLELRQILKDLGGPDRSRGVYGHTKEKIGRFIKEFDQISPYQIWEEQKEYKNQKIKADTFFMANLHFKEWMQNLDRLFTVQYGLSIHDLPDMCFRDWFDSGMEPDEVMEEEFPDFETVQELVMG